MTNKRIRTITLILSIVVLIAVGSWLAGSRIQSPAEAAARTAPPTPSAILVPVEQRVLTADLVTRGTARYGLPQALSLVPSTMKGAAAIITTLPIRGVELVEGDLLLTASERPVFLLEGATPVYRDLLPGLTGSDVEQLEAALQRMGFDPGVVDGTFDEATAAAVTAWYSAGSWPVAPPSPTRSAEIQQLTMELATAQRELTAAEDAVAVAPLQIDAVRANGEQANKAAAAVVAKKVAERDNVTATAGSSEAAVAAANAEVEAAQAAATATELDGEVALQTALGTQKQAARAVNTAQAAVDRLTAELAMAQRILDGYVPADELVFVPSLPVRVEELHAAIGDAAQGVVLLVTNNQLAVDSQLSLDEAALIKPGMAVAIDEPDLGIQATGTVARVAASPGTDGVDGYHVYFETTVNETATAIDGFSLRLTIPVESTDGQVIVVPISALSLKADGQSIVQVDSNGTLTALTVEPGLAADGLVEVTAVDGELSPGQLVVVGYEAQE